MLAYHPMPLRSVSLILQVNNVNLRRGNVLAYDPLTVLAKLLVIMD